MSYIILYHSVSFYIILYLNPVNPRITYEPSTWSQLTNNLGRFGDASHFPQCPRCPQCFVIFRPSGRPAMMIRKASPVEQHENLSNGFGRSVSDLGVASSIQTNCPKNGFVWALVLVHAKSGVAKTVHLLLHKQFGLWGIVVYPACWPTDVQNWPTDFK